MDNMPNNNNNKKKRRARRKKITACAYCRARGEQCDPERCMMAPFFPAECWKDFQKARSLFGVKSIKKMLAWVPYGWPRKAAAESLLYEASARKANPSGGCHAILFGLRAKVDAASASLDAVKARLAEEKAKAESISPSSPQPQQILSKPGDNNGASSSGLNEDNANPRDYRAYLETIDEELELCKQELTRDRKTGNVSYSNGKQITIIQEEEKEEEVDYHGHNDDDEEDYYDGDDFDDGDDDDDDEDEDEDEDEDYVDDGYDDSDEDYE